MERKAVETFGLKQNKVSECLKLHRLICLATQTFFVLIPSCQYLIQHLWCTFTFAHPHPCIDHETEKRFSLPSTPCESLISTPSSSITAWERQLEQRRETEFSLAMSHHLGNQKTDYVPLQTFELFTVSSTENIKM